MDLVDCCVVAVRGVGASVASTLWIAWALTGGLVSLSRQGIFGCVFDFDGTIVLSEHVHMQAWEDLSAEVNKPLPPEFLRNSVGRSDSELVVVMEEFWQRKISSREIYERKRAHYLRRSQTECSLVPGVVPVLRAIALQVPVVLATNSSRHEVEPILAHFELQSYFQTLFTAESVNKPKPDPEIYLKACAFLGFSPEACLAFEDSPAGSQAARDAGCQLITLGTLFDPSSLGATLFGIQDFLDPKISEFVTER